MKTKLIMSVLLLIVSTVAYSNDKIAPMLVEYILPLKILLLCRELRLAK